MNILKQLKNKINSYIPKMTHTTPYDGGFLFKLVTDCEEDECTKLYVVFNATWRTYTFDGYKFIKPKKYIVSSKSSFAPGAEMEVDVRYGISFPKEDDKYVALMIEYGSESTPYDELTDQIFIWRFPWREHILKYHYLLDLNGNIVFKDTDNYNEIAHFDDYLKFKKECQPTVTYNVVDRYDGTKLTATVRIEERCWTTGIKSFRWLRYFIKPIIRRVIDIEFSTGVGPGKDTWKGGAISLGYEMGPGETVDDTFIRFCNNTKYVVFGIQN